MARRASRTGFTIVELLIVVVVIAILAAITIVAYNGITNRAKNSAASSAAESAAKKVMTFAVTNSDVYPSTLADSGVVDANGTTYQYRVDNAANPKTFCVTATANSVSYFVSSANATPTAGACAGHGANGATTITNLVTNPSLEVSGVWGTANSATCTRQAASAIVGSWGLSCSTTNASDSGAIIPHSITFQAGQTYTASVSIRALTAGSYSLSPQGTGGSSSRTTLAMTANQVARITYTWTPTATGGAMVYALKQGGTTGTYNFDVDGGMIVQGTNGVYADGGTSGWAWDGATGLSTSSGTPL